MRLWLYAVVLVTLGVIAVFVVLGRGGPDEGYTEADLRADLTRWPEIFMILCDTGWTPPLKITEAIGEERAQAILREECAANP